MIRAMNSGGTREQLRIRYHRDFDGMVSGAVLAHILQEQGEKPEQYLTPQQMEMYEDEELKTKLKEKYRQGH